MRKSEAENARVVMLIEFFERPHVTGGGKSEPFVYDCHLLAPKWP